VSAGWRRRTWREGRLQERTRLERRVDALMELATGLYGSDRVVFKAAKLESLKELRSPDARLRALALGRIVLDDPTLEAPVPASLDGFLDRIEEELAELMARRSVEDRLERRVAEKMQERHEAYVREIKHQVLSEDGGPENAMTLRRFATLEKLDSVHLNRPVLHVLRPASLDEVVGQDRAVAAMVAKMASPFPQHILLYGPPGTGKTTVARLALAVAKQRGAGPFQKDAPFVEVDGTTLRWDPREVSNPLLGSVHDPIYQGARRELAEGGVPEPKLGLVSEAHGGVLFIDEIGEMDPLLQAKLLKVLEEKRVRFDSSYYDPADAQVPKYIKKMFEDGAPADFVLIGATTRDPDELSPALRSRCAEIYFDPLGPESIVRIVEDAARRLGVILEAGLAERVAEYTTEGRKAVGLLADAYGHAFHRDPGQTPVLVRLADLLVAAQAAHLAAVKPQRARASAEVGHAHGLAVSGHVGTVLEIEAVAFEAREPGKGQIRFNETAGSMARDSVFNAASVLRRLTGHDLSQYDLHVNVVGGGKVDGPSAGVAMLAAILSAVTGRPLRGDVAMTGEISLHGRLRPVGGVHEKLLGAARAGMRTVVVPAENAAEAPDLPDLEVVAVQTFEEVLPHLFADPVPEGVGASTGI
jgi:ATP-dependent Lon protease